MQYFHNQVEFEDFLVRNKVEEAYRRLQFVVDDWGRVLEKNDDGLINEPQLMMEYEVDVKNILDACNSTIAVGVISRDPDVVDSFFEAARDALNGMTIEYTLRIYKNATTNRTKDI